MDPVHGVRHDQAGPRRSASGSSANRSTGMELQEAVRRRPRVSWLRAYCATRDIERRIRRSIIWPRRSFRGGGRRRWADQRQPIRLDVIELPVVEVGARADDADVRCVSAGLELAESGLGEGRPVPRSATLCRLLVARDGMTAMDQVGAGLEDRSSALSSATSPLAARLSQSFPSSGAHPHREQVSRTLHRVCPSHG